MPKTQSLLTLNAGSSSIKFALFEGDETPVRMLSGAIDKRPEGAILTMRMSDGKTTNIALGNSDSSQISHDDMIRDVLDHVTTFDGGRTIDAVGHRVLLGGAHYTKPIAIDDEVYTRLSSLTTLAPLHQPACLAPMRPIESLHPDLLQVACFDTSFHHTIPTVRTRLPLPSALLRDGVRVYGFHGLSYDYIASELETRFPAFAHKRVLVAHIGNGASLCALEHGKSVGTTMGLTVLDGLMMGTRCGSIDPGVILYLLEQEDMPLQKVKETLYYRSGLLGVSGLSSDVRVLREHEADADVQLALEMYVERVVQQAGGLIAQMGGIDALVFTGGVGQNDATFRASVCQRLRFLGIRLNENANLAHRTLISKKSDSVPVLVIPADEETTIFRQTNKILKEHHLT